MFDTILPEAFAEFKSETGTDEANRFRMLSLQGFLMKFYLQISAEIDQQQVSCLAAVLIVVNCGTHCIFILCLPAIIC